MTRSAHRNGSLAAAIAVALVGCSFRHQIGTQAEESEATQDASGAGAGAAQVGTTSPGTGGATGGVTSGMTGSGSLGTGGSNSSGTGGRSSTAEAGYASVPGQSGGAPSDT